MLHLIIYNQRLNIILPKAVRKLLIHQKHTHTPIFSGQVSRLDLLQKGPPSIFS